MRPGVWRPAVELSAAEAQIVRRVRRAKLFVMLRQRRHELFDEQFQEELAGLYGPGVKGQPPVPPARLALATILQAYTGVSDDEVIEALVMDRRWQLVLDCLDVQEPPFAKGTLQNFRNRLIGADLDRRLIERTVELAATPAAGRALRAALDSSPLWGVGRVEDTLNLMGHALRKALGVIAVQQGWGLAEGTAGGIGVLAGQAGAPVLAGSSLKAALDLDWDDPAARDHALATVLGALEAVAGFVAAQPQPAPAAVAAVAVARQVRDQDVDTDAGTLRRGVAKDRRISVEDPDMRHGRKSRSRLFDGYKRHVLRDLDTGLIAAVGITPANVPEATVTDAITADLAAADTTLAELHIDRAYLPSTLVRDRGDTLAIFCKAWRVRNSNGRYTKTDFRLDFDRGQLTCPNQATIPFTPGKTVTFPKATCAACPLRSRCTTSSSGRSIAVHPDEALLAELRERQATPAGRAQLRERVAVEHALAHIGHWQGHRARYRGTRKNLFDLRRTAVVHNLHIIARQPDQTAA
ncbi:IS1182 family transposase [Dactylosporangium sp. CA-092794]|uniref:IS1182 family transposase n=1 Tax=Dactylosporangium sp. CA-092794 TaxID=3239929 RepID=UPI003D8D4111